MPDLDERRPLELRDYVQVLRRRAWVVIAIAALCGAGAVGLSLAQTKKYQAGTDILIESRPSTQVFDDGSQFVDRARAVETEKRVLLSAAVRDAATKKLGHPPEVSVDASEGSDVVTITATSTTPRRAARDANIYANTYVAFRRAQTVDDLTQAGTQLQAKITEIEDELDALPADSAQRAALEDQHAFLSQQLDRVEVSANVARSSGAVILAKADVPTSPSSPQPARNGVLGVAIGLLLGIALAFLLEYFDDRIKSKEDLERAAQGVPVLGEIPVVRSWRKRADPVLVSIEDPVSPPAEAYRTLRTSVQFLGIDRDLRSVQVTSARSEEGKTTTIANLAVALARAGQSVVVICCDLRRPRLHEFFGLSNSIGFTSVLLGEVTLTKALALVPEEGKLAVLPSGPPPPNPSELLASARTREVLDQLKQSADIVLVDSPPLLPVSDGIVLANLVDATIVVAKAGSSSRRALHRVVDTLRRVGANFAGTVLNGTRVGGDGYGYGYGGYTGTGYEQPPERKEQSRPNGNGRTRRKVKAAAESDDTAPNPLV